jgi:dTDP-L-rhamnose 4-epimerase
LDSTPLEHYSELDGMTGRMLLTGGTGFIGTNLTRALLHSGRSVTVFGRKPWTDELPADDKLKVFCGELTDTHLLSESLKDAETIFHKASSYLRTGGSEEIFQSNVNGTEALVHTLSTKSNNVRKLIFDSSISVYGEGSYHCNKCNKVRPPIRTGASVAEANSFELHCPTCKSRLQPSCTTETDDLNGESSYATSKKMQEEILRQSAKANGYQLLILRYASVYGAGQTIIKSPYARMLEALGRGDTVTLNEDGQQKRDFIHIDDVVAANLLALETTENESLTLNLGTGIETSLLEFVESAQKLVKDRLGIGPGKVIVTNQLQAGDIRHCKIDVAAVQKRLDFKPTVTLEHGLERWISDYRQCVAL